MYLQKVTSNKKKFLVVILNVTDKNIRIRSISQRYESTDPDQDPNLNVTDPQH
jgi:hypothetical protein